jgi:BON domain
MFRLASWIVGACLLLAVPWAHGGVIPVAPATAEAVERDLKLTIAARRALWQDPDLARFNIGVKVRNRVAVLWGPVPSVEIAFKAEVCVQGLIELSAVRNELFVKTDGVLVEKALAPSAPTMLPAAPPPALPGLPFDRIPGMPARMPAPAAEPPPDDDLELPPMRLPQPKTPSPKV